jgi:hypothetical protein
LFSIGFLIKPSGKPEDRLPDVWISNVQQEKTPKDQSGSGKKSEPFLADLFTWGADSKTALALARELSALFRLLQGISPIPQREMPIPQRELPIPQRELPIPQRELPIPQRELPIPQRELPIPQRKLSIPPHEEMTDSPGKQALYERVFML